MIDIACAYKQYSQLGHVTPALALVCAFQGWYVLDALYFEDAILTTMDITSDGFGFMLAFGDLAWVPFTYTLQARFLVDHPQALSPLAVAALVALQALGYLTFRGANSQKDVFRRDPSHPRVRNLRTLPTKRGTRLIISGWWGMARHINYFGDWVMAWAWCLPTGFQSVVPYFYVAYFGALLGEAGAGAVAIKGRGRRGRAGPGGRHPCTPQHTCCPAQPSLTPAPAPFLPRPPRSAPRPARRARVPGQVRQGLGRVLRHRQVPPRSPLLLAPPSRSLHGTTTLLYP